MKAQAKVERNFGIFPPTIKKFNNLRHLDTLLDEIIRNLLILNQKDHKIWCLLLKEPITSRRALEIAIAKESQLGINLSIPTQDKLMVSIVKKNELVCIIDAQNRGKNTHQQPNRILYQ